MMKYYLKYRGVEHGPFTYEQICKVGKSGRMGESDLVRTDAEPDKWVRIADVDVITPADEKNDCRHVGLIWNWSRVILPTVLLVAVLGLISMQVRLAIADMGNSQTRVEPPLNPTVASPAQATNIAAGEPVVEKTDNVSKEDKTVKPMLNNGNWQQVQERKPLITVWYCFHPNKEWTDARRLILKNDLNDYIDGLPDYERDRTPGRSTMLERNGDQLRLYGDNERSNRELNNEAKAILQVEQYRVIQDLNDLGGMMPDLMNPIQNPPMSFMNFKWGRSTRNISLTFDISTKEGEATHFRQADAEILYAKGTRERVEGNIMIPLRQVTFDIPTVNFHNIKMITITAKR